jgi:hypothetical protein
MEKLGIKAMTEAEWLNCSDPKVMLEYLRDKTSDRKFRLFAVACCRRVERYFEDDCCLRAVDLVEQYVDGKANIELLRSAVRKVEEITDDIPSARVARNAADVDFGGITAGDYENAVQSAFTASEEAAEICLDFDNEPLTKPNAFDRERIEQCDLLRGIIGNPFRPITLNPAVLAWNDATVVRLARAAYEERQLPSGEFDLHRLAVLADALEEAGAPDELVANLRSPGPHVRGCWAVDLCLGLS